MRGRALVLAGALSLLAGAGLAQDAPGNGAPVDLPEVGAGLDPELPVQTIETPPDTQQIVIAPVLTVDQEALFTGSAWGARVQAEFEETGRLIAEENERLAQQLSAEEADLTERRREMEPAEFRQLAEAFDTRATEVRRERAQAVQDLNARAEADRTAYYQAALPIMGQVMTDRGAVAVLDRRTVFVSLDVIDITAELIARIDDQLGDGSTPPPDAD